MSLAQAFAENHQSDEQPQYGGDRGVIALLDGEAQSDLIVSAPHRQQTEKHKSVGRRDRQVLQQSPQRPARVAGPDQIEQRAFNDYSNNGYGCVTRKRHPRESQPSRLLVLRSY